MTNIPIAKSKPADLKLWRIFNQGDKPIVAVSDHGCTLIQPGFGISYFGGDIRIVGADGRNVRFDE